jgi:membrane-associated phospholipid phosphatase
VDLEKRPDEPSLGHELRTAAVRLALPFAVVFGLVVLFGLLLTKVINDTEAVRQDGWLVRWLADHRTGPLNTLTHYGTLLGETPTIVALTAVFAAVFRVAFHRWRESVLLVACVSGQALIFLFTTLLIDRNRPTVPHLDDSPPTSSFPSGHTAAATTCYLGAALLVAWHTRERWLTGLLVALGVLLPLTVASCRMYRGMHHPSDVLTSLVLGVVLLGIALTLMPLRERVAVTT